MATVSIAFHDNPASPVKVNQKGMFRFGPEQSIFKAGVFVHQGAAEHVLRELTIMAVVCCEIGDHRECVRVCYSIHVFFDNSMARLQELAMKIASLIKTLEA